MAASCSFPCNFDFTTESILSSVRLPLPNLRNTSLSLSAHLRDNIATLLSRFVSYKTKNRTIRLRRLRVFVWPPIHVSPAFVFVLSLCTNVERTKWTRFTLVRTLLREWLNQLPDLSPFFLHVTPHPSNVSGTFDFSLHERINLPDIQAAILQKRRAAFFSCVTLFSTGREFSVLYRSFPTHSFYRVMFVTL